MKLVSNETIPSVSDKTLERVVNLGNRWWGDPEIQRGAAELLQLRAEKRLMLESLQRIRDKAEQMLSR